MKRGIFIFFLVFLLAIEVVYGDGGEFGVVVSVVEEEVPPPGAPGGGGGGGRAVPVPKEEAVAKVPLGKDALRVEPGIIRVSIKLGDFIEKSISVSNTVLSKLDVNVEVIGLGDVVRVEGSSFSLEGLQKRSFNVIFDATREGLEAGVYSGKIIFSVDGIKKEVLVIVEVETKRVIFDVKGYIPPGYKKVVAGGDILNNIDLYNIEGVEEADVHFTYQIRDFNGNVIITEYENITARFDFSFTKKLTLPEYIGTGEYVFVVIARYETSVATATDVFEVVLAEELLAPFGKVPIQTLIIAIIIVIFIIVMVLVRHQIKIRRWFSRLPRKYIYGMLKRGYSKEYIKRNLLSVGWPEELVDKEFERISPKPILTERRKKAK